jgi:predicted nucleotidyltransferase
LPEAVRAAAISNVAAVVSSTQGAGSPTVFPELNELLGELVSRVESTLGKNLVGAYLTGSFALGDADLKSDCDFVVVTKDRVTADQERALRELHDEIPTRSGYWAHNLEGSYAPRADLETLEALDKRWLYVDRGWREMQWSRHCNREDVRWTLRERGITLAGPQPRSLVAKVSTDVLRSKMPPLLASFVPDLLSWTSFDIAWSQRYAVTTVCRMLYTFDTGEVASKRASLEWAKHTLSPEWQDLILQVLDDRPLAWNDPPRPGSVEATKAFVDYGKERSSPAHARRRTRLGQI